MNRKPSQADKVLQYMKNHRFITAYEAMQYIGVMRLSARIYELKENGYNIGSETVEVQNRYGETCRVKRYWLIEGI